MTAPAITVVVVDAVELCAGDVVVIGECRGPVMVDPIVERAHIVTAFLCRVHGCRHPLQRALLGGVAVEVD